MVTSRVVRLIKVIQPSIDKCQQNSQGRAFSFDNYPAVIRTCRRYYHLLHLSSKIQRSQVSAFHASYRISLRSSSIHDPSDPPLRVFTLVLSFLYISQCIANKRVVLPTNRSQSTAPFEISYDCKQSKRSVQALVAYDSNHHTSLPWHSSSYLLQQSYNQK